MIDLLHITQNSMDEYTLAQMEMRMGGELYEKMELLGHLNWMKFKNLPTYQIIDEVAIINVKGSLIKEFDYIGYQYITGYNALDYQLNKAFTDIAVKSIAMVFDSHGGSMNNLYALCDTIKQLKAEYKKPIGAIVQGGAYSAAYAIAVMADEIACCPHAGVGSIGVYINHVEYSKYYEQVGAKFTLIKSGEHKAQGNIWEPLPQHVEKELQKKVDLARVQFSKHVATNRNIEFETVHDTEAKSFSGQKETLEAVKLGLIDQIISPSDAFAAMVQHNRA